MSCTPKEPTWSSMVVVRDGLTLVTTKEASVDLKTLIANLPPSVRDRE